MATYHLVKLCHLTPLHMGTGRESYDTSSAMLQSDTLSSALAAIRCQQGQVDGVADFLDSFTISSAFPYLESSLFFPKPQGRLDQIRVKGKQESEYRKSLKHVLYIEYPLWQRIIRGQDIEIDMNQISGEFISCEPIDGKLYQSQLTQRVRVPADASSDSEPFFFDWKFFHDNAGLFCLVDAPDDVFAEITSLFQSLGESGIGSDKNVGGGQFDVEVSSWDLETPEDADSTLLLSTYIPAESELPILHLSESKYSILYRGGYMAGSNNQKFRHLRKKGVYCFNFGSMFSTTENLKGKIVDLAPSWNDEAIHPVFRSGKPLCVPIKTRRI